MVKIVTDDATEDTLIVFFGNVRVRKSEFSL